MWQATFMAWSGVHDGHRTLDGANLFKVRGRLVNDRGRVVEVLLSRRDVEDTVRSMHGWLQAGPFDDGSGIETNRLRRAAVDRQVKPVRKWGR